MTNTVVIIYVKQFRFKLTAVGISTNANLRHVFLLEYYSIGLLGVLKGHACYFDVWRVLRSPRVRRFIVVVLKAILELATNF